VLKRDSPPHRMLSERTPSPSRMAQENFGQVYMSNRKAMILKCTFTLHTEGPNLCLLDSGATENFMSLVYAKMVETIFQRLPHDRPLYNVVGPRTRLVS